MLKTQPTKTTLARFWLCSTAPIARFECTDGQIGVATLPSDRLEAVDCPDEIAAELGTLIAAWLMSGDDTDIRCRGFDASFDAAWSASDRTYDDMKANYEASLAVECV